MKTQIHVLSFDSFGAVYVKFLYCLS